MITAPARTPKSQTLTPSMHEKNTRIHPAFHRFLLTAGFTVPLRIGFENCFELQGYIRFR